MSVSGTKKSAAGRYLLIATCFICVAIAGVGVGLGVYLYTISNKLCNDECNPTTTSKPTTSHPPQTTPSGIFVSPSYEGHYRFAAIASDAIGCAPIGTDILGRRGGSAVDAAIATLLCQCVQNAHSCGIGGGHYMTIYNRKNNTVHTIIAREMAPGAADENMYVPENKSSTEGGLAVGVPGEIRGYYEAWKIGGKLPWEELFKPTIKLLRDGMTVHSSLANAIQASKRFYKDHKNLRDFVTNPDTYGLYKEGDKMKMLRLASTLETISKEGPDAFYNGSLSKSIVEDMTEAGGIITEEDLRSYRAVVKDPLVIRLKDNSTVYSVPPPSSGAVLMMIMNIADEYGFNPESIKGTDNSILTWHRIVEALKFAYAKRSSLGDGDGEDQEFRDNLQGLLNNMTSESYSKYVRSMITDDRTHDFMYYGPTFYDQSKTGTSHLSVLAGNGDAVSVTSTINLYFGSKVVGSKTGIIFNNEMDDFSTPNTTNSFGVPASAANFIKPGKRPLSSMCPTIVVDKDGAVRLIVGASGGTKITTATALVSIQTLWFGLDIKEAIDHRRIHHQLLPKELQVEKGFPEDVLEGLRKKGHEIIMVDSAGSVVQSVLQTREGDITANSDFRKGGEPDGY